MASTLIRAFVEVVIGIALVPVAFSLVTAANVTGVTATILGLTPLFLVIGIIYSQTAHLLK